MVFDFDSDLQTYFTDMEQLRDLFRRMLLAQDLPRRLLVIHGVGGIGKTSLLRMFRLRCKQENVPVGLASGDEPEAKSVVGVLDRWVKDLQPSKIALPTFTKTLKHYLTIQAKVNEQAGKGQETREKVAEGMGKAAAKVIVKGTLGAIPVVGGLASELGGAGAEALIDLLRGKGFAKADIDLLLDPTKRLTDDFLTDIAKIAPKQRLILIVDTFEQLAALEDWARDFAQQLHPNILLVLAGRVLPDWNRQWPSWMAQAEIHELKPMTEDVMRDLVRRYYATMRGGEPAPKQVEAILRFARGLPMVVTSAVQLWVKYGVEDFQAIKPEIVANLVDRLMEGVPSALVPALEAVAAVRWFDQPILRAVMNQPDVREIFDELRRFPFVRVRSEGFALHDAIREIMDENLRVQDTERHHDLHGRAATYFERRTEQASGEEADQLGLEQLYHRVCADEETGLRLFRQIAEELTRYRLVNRLRAVLNDVNTYPLEHGNSILWRVYYNARLAHLEVRLPDAELMYQAIVDNPKAEARLKAYSLCGLGIILSRWRRLGIADNASAVIDILNCSLQLTEPDTFLLTSVVNLAHVYDYLENWDMAVQYHDNAIELFRKHGDNYRLVDACSRKRVYCGQRGEWKEMFDADQLGQMVLPKLVGQSYYKARFLGWSNWAWAFVGRYAEGEGRVKGQIDFMRQIEERESVADFSRDLGLLLALQDRFSEAARCFDECWIIGEQLHDYEAKLAFGHSHWGVALMRQGKFAQAQEALGKSLRLLEKFGMKQDMPETHVLYGQSYELDQNFAKAEEQYVKCLDLRKARRHYFECAALAGLARIKYVQGDYTAIPPLLTQAEQLAREYEYNDQLVSLRLVKGIILGDSTLDGQATPLEQFQQAVIYAVRFNRYLLDEVLNGRPQGTVLHAIVPHCLSLGETGRQLLRELRDWWSTGKNDVGTLHPDTISPIPEGISLLEAERIARNREPGDGSPQKTVVEQIEAALAE